MMQVKCKMLKQMIRQHEVDNSACTGLNSNPFDILSSVTFSYLLSTHIIKKRMWLLNTSCLSSTIASFYMCRQKSFVLIAPRSSLYDTRKKESSMSTSLLRASFFLSYPQMVSKWSRRYDSHGK